MGAGRSTGRATGLWRGLWPPSLIIVGGLSLWLAWPAPPRVNPDHPPPRALRVRHVPAGAGAVRLHWAPDLFGRPSRVGFGGVRADAPDEGLAPMPVPPPALFAATTMPPQRVSAPALDAPVPTVYGPRIAPPDPGFKTFTAGQPGGWRVVVTGLPPGVVWPEGGTILRSESAPGWANGTWEIRLQVAFDGESRPSAVWVESGSGDAARDQAVVRWLEQTSVAKTGMVCQCRLWIGRLPESASPRQEETGDGR